MKTTRRAPGTGGYVRVGTSRPFNAERSRATLCECYARYLLNKISPLSLSEDSTRPGREQGEGTSSTAGPGAGGGDQHIGYRYYSDKPKAAVLGVAELATHAGQPTACSPLLGWQPPQRHVWKWSSATRGLSAAMSTGLPDCLVGSYR